MIINVTATHVFVCIPKHLHDERELLREQLNLGLFVVVCSLVSFAMYAAYKLWWRRF